MLTDLLLNLPELLLYIVQIALGERLHRSAIRPLSAFFSHEWSLVTITAYLKFFAKLWNWFMMWRGFWIMTIRAMAMF